MRISDWSSDVCSSDLQAKGRLRWDDAHACFVPDEAMQAGQRVAGAANGSFGLGSCLVQGEGAGLAAAEACGFPPLVVAEPPQADNRDFLPGRWLWLVPGLEPLGPNATHFVAQLNADPPPPLNHHLPT